MSEFLIYVLIVETAIFIIFDNRKSTFNALLCGTVLIGAIYFTFKEFGFSWMLLLPTLVAMIVGGFIGGIYQGLKIKRSRS